MTKNNLYLKVGKNNSFVTIRTILHTSYTVTNVTSEFGVNPDLLLEIPNNAQLGFDESPILGEVSLSLYIQYRVN